MKKRYYVDMVRIILLALVSICFTALKIYADCDLPTGGACSIDALKQKQAQNELLQQENSLQELDKKYFGNNENEVKKDLHKQVNFDILKKLNLKNY